MGDTPVSDQFPGNVPGSYVVSAGDTLRGIALAMFGDAQLWYLIADANGLKSDAELQVGRNLTVPNKVTNLRNASDTFKPYAPGKIIGDTTPTLPNPPPPPAPKHHGKKGCGGVGAIVVAVVAIVATVLTAGALAAPLAEGLAATWTAGMGALGAGISGAGLAGTAFGTLGFAGFAVAGAVGSIVSQGVGMALGVQDKFSWSGVAMGAISSVAGGAATSIVGGTSLPAMIGRAVVGNVISQGVGVAIGAQKSFSWAGVAAAGVSAGVSYGMDQILPEAARGSFGGLVRESAISMASGAARQVVAGGKVSWGNVAADAFGNALGNTLGEHLVASEQQAKLDEARELRLSTGYTPADYSLSGGKLNAMGDSTPVSFTALDSGSPEADPSRVREVQVRAGDTLTRIAGTADPKTLDQIAEFNGLRSRHEIRAGQTLRIPDAATLDQISVSDAVAKRGTDGAAYYAERQRLMQEAQAATTANYGNEGRSVPGAIVVSASAAPSGYAAAAAGEFDPLGTGSANYDTATRGLVTDNLGTALYRLGRGVVTSIAEIPLQVVDLVQGSAAAAYTVTTGSPANISFYSHAGQAAQAGATTTELLHNLNPMYSLMVAGYEGYRAIENGDVGTVAEIGGGILGGSLLAKGVAKAPGYQPGIVSAGTRQFVSDTMYSLGEELSMRYEQYSYRMGMTAYAIPPEVWVSGHLRAAEKGFAGVRATENGGPTFVDSPYLYPVSEGQLNRVGIKLTGDRSADFRAANEAAGFSRKPTDYSWHHVDDFDPKTGKATLELVETAAHRATTPHKGSVAQFVKYFGWGYEK